MEIVSARLVLDDKAEDGKKKKPNLERAKAQPLIDMNADRVFEQHAIIKARYEAQRNDWLRRFNVNGVYAAQCYDCGNVNSLRKGYDQNGHLVAQGECYFCGAKIVKRGPATYSPEWPNEVRNAVFTSAKVGVVHLIDFMMSAGLEDLSMTYLGRSVYQHYRGRDVARRNAIRDEAIVYEMMKACFDAHRKAKLLFKISGSNVEHQSFPDLVVKTNGCVYILEVKMSEVWRDDEQLSKYHQSMKAIEAKNAAPKNVATVLVSGSDLESVAGQYTTIAELLHIREPGEVEAHLLLHAAYVSKWIEGAYIDMQP
jgi:hypothetical protein